MSPPQPSAQAKSWCQVSLPLSGVGRRVLCVGCCARKQQYESNSPSERLFIHTCSPKPQYQLENSVYIQNSRPRFNECNGNSSSIGFHCYHIRGVVSSCVRCTRLLSRVQIARRSDRETPLRREIALGLPLPNPDGCRIDFECPTKVPEEGELED
jgi:hypothetical protein